MKTNILLTLLMTALAGTTSNVSAADSTTQPLDFLGAPAPAHAPVDKVIVITDNTRYVNVANGSTVRFVVDGHAFTWYFENGNVHIASFDLRRIAPKGLLDHDVKTYVADNPLYQS